MNMFGLRGTDLANKTGLTRGTVSRHMSGDCKPRRQTIETFAMATGKTYGEVEAWFEARYAERQQEIAERQARWAQHCQVVGE
jgi:transcriptional regulator with XRE-family HTH domain